MQSFDLSPAVTAQAKRLGWKPLGVTVFWFTLGLVVIGQEAEVTTFRQLDLLRPAQAADGRVATFNGVVLCYDGGWGQLYIHDGTEVRYFSPQQFTSTFEQGQQVSISGKTAVIDGRPGLTNLTIHAEGLRELPPAEPLDLSMLGSNHGQWVVASGRVRSADTSKGRLGLKIYSQGRDCQVYVLGPTEHYDFRRLLDCSVRVRGINASKIVNGQLESACVFASGTNDVQVLEPQLAELSRMPVSPVEAVLSRKLGAWTNRLIHLNGLVTACKPGEFLVLRDPTGVIRAEGSQMDALGQDQRVDLWGFLTVRPTETLLTYSYFETTHPTVRARVENTLTEPPNLSTNEVAPVTRVAAVKTLPRSDLARHVPVRLRGVITFADPEFHNGFVQDETGAIYLDLTQRDVQAGQFVELTGRADPGGFAPQVNDVAVSILGITNYPTPVRVSLDDLAGGQFDSCWVELSGVVRHAELDWHHLYVTLTSPKGRFRVVIPGCELSTLPNRLIDAMVSVVGACSSEVNPLGQLSGITLLTPNVSCLHILDPIPTDPFAVGTRAIASVSTYDPIRRLEHRVKVSGVVTLVLPGRGFFLQDDSGGIRVSTLATNAVRVGDALEALGFVVLRDYSPGLDDASFRRTGAGVLPPCKRLAAEDILRQGQCDGQLVEVEATLAQVVPRSAQPRLVLQDGPIIFTAHEVSKTPGYSLSTLRRGSLLRVRGICAIQCGEQQDPEAFRLLLADPRDVLLLRGPNWWTPQHALLVVSALAAAILVATMWVFSLRRRVRAQTDLLRRDLEERKRIESALHEKEHHLRLIAENTSDAIFAFDMDRRPSYVNSAVKLLTGYTVEEVLARGFISWVHPDDRQRMQRQWDNLFVGKSYTDAEFRLVTKTGEVRWCASSWGPIWDETGRQIGVQGREQDITERRHLEHELLEISAKERRRLGHDLHDGLGQHLAGIALKTKVMEEMLAAANSPQSSAAREVVRLINNAIRQTRNLAKGLDPVHVEADGVVAALGTLSAQSQDLFRLDCIFTCSQQRLAINPEASLALYRIAQEAIHNAAVHGGASRVEMSLELSDTRLYLKIRDNGQGIPPGPSSGMGLHIMRYRARSVGGILGVESTPGVGTTIFFSAPPELCLVPKDDASY